MPKGDKPTHEFYTYDNPTDPLNVGTYAPPTLVRTKTSIFVNEDTIRLTVNHYFADRNRHSGKVYYYWKRSISETFFKTKDGRLLVTRRQYKQSRADRGSTATVPIPQTYFTHHTYLGSRYRGTFVPVTNVYLQVSDHQEFFNEAFEKLFGTRDTQPLAHLYGQDHILSTFRDPRTLTAYLFGKSRVRKDLVKAVASTDISGINHLTFAALFRDLVPVDWLVYFLQRNVITEADAMRAFRMFGPHEWLPNSRAGRKLRKAILSIDPKNYRRILRSEFAVTNQILADTFLLCDHTRPDLADTWPRHATGRIRSVNELHDAMVDVTNMRVARGDHVHDNVLPARYESIETKNRKDKLWLSLKDSTIGKYQVILPSKSEDLEDWGNYMHNCIGSYRRYINDSDRVLGAIKDDERIVACFEVLDGRLNQLLGRFNQTLPDEQRLLFHEAFKSRGVDVSYYTGLSA